MKTFNVDVESISSSAYSHGMAEVHARLTVTENREPLHEFSFLNLSEATMRRLHDLLGRHIRSLDERKT